MILIMTRMLHAADTSLLFNLQGVFLKHNCTSLLARLRLFQEKGCKSPSPNLGAPIREHPHHPPITPTLEGLEVAAGPMRTRPPGGVTSSAGPCLKPTPFCLPQASGVCPWHDPAASPSCWPQPSHSVTHCAEQP